MFLCYIYQLQLVFFPGFGVLLVAEGAAFKGVNSLISDLRKRGGEADPVDNAFAGAPMGVALTVVIMDVEGGEQIPSDKAYGIS